MLPRRLRGISSAFATAHTPSLSYTRNAGQCSIHCKSIHALSVTKRGLPGLLPSPVTAEYDAAREDNELYAAHAHVHNVVSSLPPSFPSSAASTVAAAWKTTHRVSSCSPRRTASSCASSACAADRHLIPGRKRATAPEPPPTPDPRPHGCAQRRHSYVYSPSSSSSTPPPPHPLAHPRLAALLSPPSSRRRCPRTSLTWRSGKSATSSMRCHSPRPRHLHRRPPSMNPPPPIPVRGAAPICRRVKSYVPSLLRPGLVLIRPPVLQQVRPLRVHALVPTPRAVPAQAWPARARPLHNKHR
ncbi:hypothetical protein C8R44DRAFT_260179 [Mycena epipterygia]|nr:hypothetical protein C8R44DRAFT_260179 [Mycena epipterygia]